MDAQWEEWKTRVLVVSYLCLHRVHTPCVPLIRVLRSLIRWLKRCRSVIFHTPKLLSVLKSFRDGVESDAKPQRTEWVDGTRRMPVVGTGGAHYIQSELLELKCSSTDL